MPDTIVVEGGGKAAASSLCGIDWITAAEHLVYWGESTPTGTPSSTTCALSSSPEESKSTPS